MPTCIATRMIAPQGAMASVRFWPNECRSGVRRAALWSAKVRRCSALPAPDRDSALRAWLGAWRTGRWVDECVARCGTGWARTNGRAVEMQNRGGLAAVLCKSAHAPPGRDTNTLTLTHTRVYAGAGGWLCCPGEREAEGFQKRLPALHPCRVLMRAAPTRDPGRNIPGPQNSKETTGRRCATAHRAASAGRPSWAQRHTKGREHTQPSRAMSLTWRPWRPWRPWPRPWP